MQKQNVSIEEKEEIFNSLSTKQKKELKKKLDFFNMCLWLVEPKVFLYDVEWMHSDLIKLFKKII